MISDPTNNSVYWTCGQRINNGLFVWAISKTTDGGTNWTRVIDTTGIAYSLVMEPGNTNVVYVGGQILNNPCIYKTTNSGTTWSRLVITGLSGTIYDLVIDPGNVNVIYAGTTTSLYKSTNQGTTWSSTGFTGGWTNSICIDNITDRATTIYAGTLNNGMYRSTNNGSTWQQVNDGLGCLNINTVKVIPGQYLYACTEGGSIYRIMVPIGIMEESTTEDYEQLRVHPNPAHERLVIEYITAKAKEAKFTIYDAQGRLVREIGGGSLTAGRNSVEWDLKDRNGSRVAPGVYFYRLIAGEFQETNKIVVVH